MKKLGKRTYLKSVMLVMIAFAYIFKTAHHSDGIFLSEDGYSNYSFPARADFPKLNVKGLKITLNDWF